MRATPLLAASLAALALAFAPAAAQAGSAQSLLVLGEGKVRVVDDPFLPPAAEQPVAPAPRREPSAARAAAARSTVRGALDDLLAAGTITRSQHDGWRAEYDRSLSTRRQLAGARRAALDAVIANLEGLAARNRLTATRAPATFLTLQRNREWWREGRLLRAGQRVGFAGSQLVWEHYPGQGLQIQWLGTFGRANGLFSARGHDEELGALLEEAIPLATRRAGGIAWESLYAFGGGRAPWVSGLSQGTALQALSRGAIRLGRGHYLGVARSALGVFGRRAPEGVWAGTTARAHYLQYSWDRDLRIYNGFVQALNGLYDFAKLANDDRGQALFFRGEAQLRDELARMDTGGWSRYSNERDSPLHYHQVLRDFLRGLCERLREGRLPTDPAPYCTLAQRFTDDLGRDPVVDLRSGAAVAGRPKTVIFTIDKPATVTMTVARGGEVVERVTSAVRAGRARLIWDAPRRRGAYTVTLTATDLAGNRTTEGGPLRVER
ncbi:MAG TPA: D-glucuronyl C5-epimerase family protein [Solirubrobacteraceae bacterium]|nr:D-glucuronyl C5-epimerase family protein [Solirubrobacteraceae bacterium]